MRKVQNYSRSDRGGYISSTDLPAERVDLSSHERLIIQQANNSSKLLDALKLFGISIERLSNSDEWSVSIVCPFPNHKSGKERSASFGYNYQSDRFHCFGCNASGGTVEFISIKTRSSRIAVAEQIIRDVSGYVPNIIKAPENTDPQIAKLMFGFSEYIHNLILSNRDDINVLEQIDKITWWFDSYIVSVAPKRRVVVEELSRRISKCQEILDRFKETNE